MTMGQIIAQNRKERDMTQEALAEKLGVTNQAVSKWESGQSDPDIAVLPKLADLFEISVDALFGRENRPVAVELPWRDDGVLRAVVYRGRTLLTHMDAVRNMTFTYYGEVQNLESCFAVHCGDVTGNVDAGGSVICGKVGGSVDAGGTVECANVESGVDAGGNITCGNVRGNVDAGGSVTCGSVSGDVDAGGSVVIQVQKQ